MKILFKKTYTGSLPATVLSGKNFFSRLVDVFQKYPYLLIAGIAAAGMVLRLLVSWELLQNDPATVSPPAETDMATYITLADRVLQGVFPESFYYQPLYYTLFLPLCRLAGPSSGPAVTAVLQSILGGMIIFITGRSAMRIGGIASGIFASLATAFSAILIYFTPYALLEILQTFFVVSLFDLTLTLLYKPGWRIWLFTGFVSGLSMLTRGNTLFLLPVIFSVLIFRCGKSEPFPWKKRFLYAGLFLFAAILPQIPFAAYNTIKTGHLSGPSTGGGAGLALGNNPEASSTGQDYTPAFFEWMKKEKAISIPRRIIDRAWKNPGEFLEHKCKQFFYFWSWKDHANNISEEDNASKSFLMRHFPFLPTGIIISLALAGLFAGLIQKYYVQQKDFLLLAGFLLFYAVSIAIFSILARFRLPVLPLMCIAGGIFLKRFFLLHSLKKTFLFILCLLAGAMVCYGLCPLYSYLLEPAVMRKLLPHGVQVELEDPHIPNAAYKNWNLSVMDAGNQMQGGWNTVPVLENLLIRKEFSFEQYPVTGRYGSLVLPVKSSGGRFSVEVNGSRYHFPALPSGVTVLFLGISRVPLLFTAQTERGGKLSFSMRFYNVEGSHSIFFDIYRDYGRSFLNEQFIPGEFAIRLLLPVKK